MELKDINLGDVHPELKVKKLEGEIVTLKHQISETVKEMDKVEEEIMKAANDFKKLVKEAFEEGYKKGAIAEKQYDNPDLFFDENWDESETKKKLNNM